ncbi:uncharacterized [Tachysurus ichikawai]
MLSWGVVSCSCAEPASVCFELECWDLPQEYTVLQPQSLCGKGGAVELRTALTSRAHRPITLTHHELHGTSVTKWFAFLSSLLEGNAGHCEAGVCSTAL